MTLRLCISHSHHDEDFCRQLVHALYAAGANVWPGERAPDDSQLAAATARELCERFVFILIHSPSALASQQVRRETQYALEQYHREPIRTLPLAGVGKPLFYRRLDARLMPMSPRNAPNSSANRRVARPLCW